MLETMSNINLCRYLYIKILNYDISTQVRFFERVQTSI